MSEEHLIHPLESTPYAPTEEKSPSSPKATIPHPTSAAIPIKPPVATIAAPMATLAAPVATKAATSPLFEGIAFPTATFPPQTSNTTQAAQPKPCPKQAESPSTTAPFYIFESSLHPKATSAPASTTNPVVLSDFSACDFSPCAFDKRRRGNLPKAATMALRSWLAQNLHDPYPNEATKAHLCSQTGLRLVQLNNWFINARRRLVPGLRGGRSMPAGSVLISASCPPSIGSHAASDPDQAEWDLEDLPMDHLVKDSAVASRMIQDPNQTQDPMQPQNQNQLQNQTCAPARRGRHRSAQSSPYSCTGKLVFAKGEESTSPNQMQISQDHGFNHTPFHLNHHHHQNQNQNQNQNQMRSTVLVSTASPFAPVHPSFLLHPDTAYALTPLTTLTALSALAQSNPLPTSALHNHSSLLPFDNHPFMESVPIATVLSHQTHSLHHGGRGLGFAFGHEPQVYILAPNADLGMGMNMSISMSMNMGAGLGQDQPIQQPTQQYQQPFALTSQYIETGVVTQQQNQQSQFMQFHLQPQLGSDDIDDHQGLNQDYRFD